MSFVLLKSARAGTLWGLLRDDDMRREREPGGGDYDKPNAANSDMSCLKMSTKAAIGGKESTWWVGIEMQSEAC